MKQFAKKDKLHHQRMNDSEKAQSYRDRALEWLNPR
jgi:hypothetical protein